MAPRVRGAGYYGPAVDAERLLGLPPYRPWYRHGRRGPRILVARLRNKHQPVFRARMAWQRATRGHSDDQLWDLNHALAKLTVAGVRAMREWAHGYPAEFCEPGDPGLPEDFGARGGRWEAWDKVLAQIEEGFQLWLDCDGWFPEDSPEELKFNQAMHLYGKWFGSLWD